MKKGRNNLKPSAHIENPMQKKNIQILKKKTYIIMSHTVGEFGILWGIWKILRNGIPLQVF